MKKLLLLLSISFYLNANAQTLVMTKAVFEPVIGDTSRAYIVDTSYYTNGLNVSQTGANTVWTYSNLAATGNSISSAYVDPSSIPASTNYPGCTIVQNQGLLNTFYKSVTSPSTQTEFQGVNSTSITMNFSNTAVSMRYPFTYQDVITDNFSGAFTFSLSGSASGNATVVADGHGTLILPNGVTFNNVLRLKSTQITNFNALIITGSIRQTMYSWYDASQKFPILSINYQTMSITGAGSPTVSAQVIGNKNNFVIGVNENNLDQAQITFFPNPVSDELNIDFIAAEVKNISIYNAQGKLIVQYLDTKKINCENMANGIYIAEIKTNKGIIHKKFIKH
ncbi:MAG: T9SS type A sorting domain-containing protein [Sphingobacteriaceae bacterium]|nr:T9SS type A sorting domain-containing protein [Sphingobacteriaceae bacterium]